jgi:hypothetical protein
MPVITGVRSTHIQQHVTPPQHREPPRVAEPASAQDETPSPDNPTLMEKNAVRKIYRVRPPAGRHHESLWEIAEKCLGDGRRYREIYSLNKGKLQPDGTRLTMASLIRPGWVLDMPADATHVEIIDKGPHPHGLRHIHQYRTYVLDPQRPGPPQRQRGLAIGLIESRKKDPIRFDTITDGLP